MSTTVVAAPWPLTRASSTSLASNDCRAFWATRTAARHARLSLFLDLRGHARFETASGARVEGHVVWTERVVLAEQSVELLLSY